MLRKNTLVKLILIIFVIFNPFFATAENMTTFVNTTSSTDIRWDGVSLEPMGLFFFDYNQDRYPDLFISPHGWYPAGLRNGFSGVYVNNRGVFRQERLQILDQSGSLVTGDTHGGAVGDFDNDGDDDIFINLGTNRGRNPRNKILIVNNNGNLIDQGQGSGLEYRFARGRNATWVDFNRDGLLDLISSTEEMSDNSNKTALFLQTTTGNFRLSNTRMPPYTLKVLFSDLSGDGTRDYIYINSYGSDTPYFVYQGQNNISDHFPRLNETIFDAAIADFNNDLVPDIIFARGDTRERERGISAYAFYESTNKELIFYPEENQDGISVQTAGTITINFRNYNSQILANATYLGARGTLLTPQEKNSANVGTFVLDPSNRLSHGLSRSNQPGLYVGYEDGQWKLVVRGINDAKESLRGARIIVNSNRPISNIEPQNFANTQSTTPTMPVLFQYDQNSNRYVDQSSRSGLRDRNIRQIVYGDFDNDGDQDLVATSSIDPITLGLSVYRNDGTGRFTKVASPDFNISGIGLTDYENSPILATGDYDLNGTLDLMVGNTVFHYLNRQNRGGNVSNVQESVPFHLFRNTNNTSNWLQIDLQGVQSNRDGVGSKVYLTTPDGKIQLLEQDGGNHVWGQNYQRLHFGLGRNRNVEKIVVNWDSGIIQEINNIRANQIITIRESRTDNFHSFNGSSEIGINPEGLDTGY